MSRIRVLLVDADDTARIFLAQVLIKQGCEVIHSTTGRDSLEKLTRIMPDVIIADTNLPDYQGLEIVREFRREKAVAAIPLVMVSATADPEMMEQCLKAGANEYFIKSGSSNMTLASQLPRIIMDGKSAQQGNSGGLLCIFLSAKGGTGTSSLCANIGMNLTLNMSNSKVAVADMVLPIGSIGSIVGYDGGFNLVDVAHKQKADLTPDFFSQNLVIPKNWMFHLLPGSPDPAMANELDVQKIPEIVSALSTAYDYLLIDFGRSLSRISLPIIQMADVIVLVLGTDLSTVKLTKKTWEYLQSQGVEAKRVYPILNRAVGLEGLSKSEAEQLLGLDIRITMPYMMGNFTLANNQNLPIVTKFPTDTASLIFKQAANEISRMAIMLHAGNH